MAYPEHHKTHRSGWLRAAVMGANDGIVSTASLLIGVAAAGAAHQEVLLAGVAGLVAGAMSMAAGEYVSVSSQADLEQADLELERDSLKNNYAYECRELADIYRRRGLDDALAEQVAEQLMAHDALGAHARDEIGITDTSTARPFLAAWTSATSFTLGAALPVLIAWLVALNDIILFVACFSLTCLALLGALAAKAGGASLLTGAMRVLIWGALAMLLTALVGHLFNW